MFSLEENAEKAILSINNVLLIIAPLVSIIFTTIHYYNSYEFFELILSQPISRTKLILSEYIAIGLSLTLALIIGLGIPILLFYAIGVGIWMLMTTIALTLSCSALALMVSVRVRDKAKGIGIVLLIWFYLSLIYDGLILTILFTFSDYPLEKITLGIIALNPIDLARVSMMLQLDISALMGYTGALYKEFFGSQMGVIFTFGILILWVIVPLYFAVNYFRKKDL